MGLPEKPYTKEAARDQHFIKKGFHIPEIVMPVTEHPCYDKVAEYMGMNVVRVPVNEETLEGDPEAIRQIMGKVEENLELHGPELLKAFGMEEEFPREMAMLNELFDSIPPEIMELLVNYVVIEIFRKGL